MFTVIVYKCVSMKMYATFDSKSLDVLIFQEIKVLLWVFKKILGPMHHTGYIVPNAESSQ